MSVTSVSGFTANGIACGIKESGALDLSLVATSDGAPVDAAGVFTRNLACAAPVQVSKQHLAETKGRASAVILNSGNANAATGTPGLEQSRSTCEVVAKQLGCAPQEVLVCSTGLIGIPLDYDAIERGVPTLVEGRSTKNGGVAAQAIMTTDTHAKEVVIAGDGFTIGGMAKGAAMLAPNMATMLAVLTTDAQVSDVRGALREAVDGSFNRLLTDGSTSTNDTVLILANGTAGPIDQMVFTKALSAACTNLAEQMGRDAEGATKFVRVEIVNAASADEAQTAARKIANCQLVKCSWYGEDPYWGRIVSELGTAGVTFDPDKVVIRYNGIEACRGGIDSVADGKALAATMTNKELTVTCDLGVGAAESFVLTTDLTHAYIDENMGTS